MCPRKLGSGRPPVSGFPSVSRADGPRRLAPGSRLLPVWALARAGGGLACPHPRCVLWTCTCPLSPRLAGVGAEEWDIEPEDARLSQRRVTAPRLRSVLGPRPAARILYCIMVPLKRFTCNALASNFICEKTARGRRRGASPCPCRWMKKP